MGFGHNLPKHGYHDRSHADSDTTNYAGNIERLDRVSRRHLYYTANREDDRSERNRPSSSIFLGERPSEETREEGWISLVQNY
jgi:hypothetical protein